MSLASVPSSIKSSLVSTPMVRTPAHSGTDKHLSSPYTIISLSLFLSSSSPIPHTISAIAKNLHKTITSPLFSSLFCGQGLLLNLIKINDYLIFGTDFHYSRYKVMLTFCDNSLANSKFLGNKFSSQMWKTNTSGVKALLYGTNKSSSHFLNVFQISGDLKRWL